MPELRDLADWLAGLNKAELTVLLDCRPDALAGRPPGTLGQLAERLCRPQSLAAALRGLPAPCLQAARALHALGERRTVTALVDLLAGGSRPAVAGVLGELTALAIVWPGPGERLETPPGLGELFRQPLGCDPPLRELWREQTGDAIGRTLRRLGHTKVGRKAEALDLLLRLLATPDTVRALARSAPAEVAAELDRLAWDGAEQDGDRYGTNEDDDVQPVVYTGYDEQAYRRTTAARQWGTDHGLLVGQSWGYDYRMPAEIALALRGPGYRAPFTPQPPRVPTHPVDPAVVESAAAAAATQFAARAVAVLDRVARTPVPRLASGGVGVRELTRLAKEAGAPEVEVRLALELAAAADLVESDGRVVATSAAFPGWRQGEPAGQLAVLLLAWWALPAVPTEARDVDGKALRVLTRRPGCAGCQAARIALVYAAAALPPGSAGAPGAVAAAAQWSRPLIHVLAQDAAAPLSTIWREAELLGVLGAGSFSTLGAALVSGDGVALRAQLTAMLPATSDQAAFGSDLTVLVAGSPSARITALLDGCADRESSGGATTWRFGPSSVRRALDDGADAEGLLDALRAVAGRELPQPLGYLISDVARRHGRLLLSPAVSVITSADTALLAEVVADRRLAKLGLRLIAPTAASAAVPLAAALDRLRAVGYFPVAEPAATQPTPTGPEDDDDPPQRAGMLREMLAQYAPQATRPTTPAPPPDPAALAGRLLAGGGTAAPEPSELAGDLARMARALSYTEVDQLAHALETGARVRIDYRSASDAVTSRVIGDLELSGATITAFCELRQDERMFTLSRILSVSAVE